MLATTYQNAGDFLRKTQDFLEQDEGVNSLMLGVCLRMERFPERFRDASYFVTVEDQQRIVVAIAMMLPQKIIISGDRDDCDEAIAIVTHDLIARHWDLQSVRGPAHLAKAFAETWAKIVGRSCTIGMNLRAYSLIKVNHPRYNNGKLRVATEANIELITRWLYEFEAEALGSSDSAEVSEMAMRKVRDRDIYVWEDEQEQPVCMAGKSRPTRNGITINAVYTPPNLRGKGYATSCVASLSQLLLDSGWKFCTLFTDLSNPTSNSIYQRIGYIPVCDFTEYVFE